MEGFLVKRGGFVKNWKRRYFVLDAQGAVAYLHDGDEKGRFEVAGGALCCVPEATYGRKHCFSLTPHRSNRAYILCASSHEEMNKWLSAFIKCGAQPDSTVQVPVDSETANSNTKSYLHSSASSGPSSTPTQAKHAPQEAKEAVRTSSASAANALDRPTSTSSTGSAQATGSASLADAEMSSRAPSSELGLEATGGAPISADELAWRELHMSVEAAKKTPAVREQVWDSAYTQYHKYIEALEPEQPNADRLYFYLGCLCFDTERDSEALELFRKAVAIKPSVPEYSQKLALLLLYNNRKDEARKVLQEALQVSPTDSGLLFDMGKACQVENDHPKAIEWFNKALEANANHSGALYQLATYMLSQAPPNLPPDEMEKLNTKAENMFLRSAEIDPTHTNSWYNAAQINQKRATRQSMLRAFQYFHTAHLLEPRDNMLVSKLVQCADFLGLPQQVALYRKKIKDLFAAGAVKRDKFVCSQFKVGDCHVMVAEKFEFGGKFATAYTCDVDVPATNKHYVLALTSFALDNEKYQQSGLARPGELYFTWYGYFDRQSKRQFNSFAAYAPPSLEFIRPQIVRLVRAEQARTATEPLWPLPDSIVPGTPKPATAAAPAADISNMNTQQLKQLDEIPTEEKTPSDPSSEETAAVLSVDSAQDSDSYAGYGGYGGYAVASSTEDVEDSSAYSSYQDFDFNDEQAQLSEQKNEQPEIPPPKVPTSRDDWVKARAIVLDDRSRKLEALMAQYQSQRTSTGRSSMVVNGTPVSASDVDTAVKEAPRFTEHMDKVLARLRDAENNSTTNTTNKPLTDAAKEPTQTDWNSLYQQLYEQPTATIRESMEREASLQVLVSRFTLFAQRVARTLVSELSLPVEDKTIKPVDAGGHAGGEKFMHGNVFFKFARDFHNLYGSDDLAAKGAANEVRSMNTIVNSRVSHLHTPLSALFYIGGHAVHATALAPIGKGTMVYGSPDASATIFDESKAFRSLLTELANELNLKEHKVPDKSGRLYNMLTGVDVEGHRSSKDGRYYILDLARLLPPALPRSDPVYRADFLHRLIRPEFVQQYCAHRPLSSDAFSFFGRVGMKEHHADIWAATVWYRETLVPHVARVIDSLDRPEVHALERSATVFRDIFHPLGANLRDLGLVRSRVKSAEMRQYLLMEMIARVAKSMMRSWLRQLPFSADAQRQAVRQLVDVLFAPSPLSAKAWQHLYAQVKLKFGRYGYVEADDKATDADPSALKLRRERMLLEELESFCEIQQHAQHFRSRSPSLRQSAGSKAGDATLSSPMSELVAARFASRVFNQLNVVPSGDPLVVIRAICEEVDDVTGVLAEPKSTVDAVAGSAKDDDIMPTFVLSATVKRVEVSQFPSLEQSERNFLKALELRSQVVGPNSPLLLSTLWALVDLYQMWSDDDHDATFRKCEQMFDRLFAVEKAHPGSVRSLDSLHGKMYMHFGRYKQAQVAYAKAVEKNAAKENVARSSSCMRDLNNLANSYSLDGAWDVAKEKFREALQLFRAMPADVLADRQEKIFLSQLLTNLAAACNETGETNVLIDLLTEALDIEKELSAGLSVPTMAYGRVLTELAGAYFRLGDYEKMVSTSEEAIAVKLKTHGAGHPSIAITEGNLGVAYTMLKQHDKAKEHISIALEITMKAYGPHHPEVVRLMQQLLMANVELNDVGGALDTAQGLTKITHNMYGSQHPVFLKAFDQLAQLMKQAGLEDQLSALQLQLLMGGQANVSVGGSATGAPPSATVPAK